MTYPTISIVLPVWNEGRFIGETLTQLIAQEYPSDRFDIWVVDGGSMDNTRSEVRRVAADNTQTSINLRDNPHRLSSAGRNIGIRASKGEWVLIVDGHVYIPSTQLLQESARLITNNNVSVIGRPQRLTPPDNSKFQTAVAIVRGSPVGHSPESHIYSSESTFVSPISVGVMYKRSVFADYGLFDESFDAAEDYEFNYRLERNGLKCLISPKLEIYYYPRDTLIGLYRQMKRYGFGRARFLRRFPRRFTINNIVPSAFVVGVVVLIVAAMLSVHGMELLGAVALTYGITVAIVSARQPGGEISKSGRYIAIALAVHFGLGVGFLQGLLIRMRPSTNGAE